MEINEKVMITLKDLNDIAENKIKNEAQKEIIRSSFPPHIADRMCAAIDGQEKMEHFVRFLNEYNEWMGMQQKQQAAVMELATPSSVTTRQCSCKHGTAFAVPSVFEGV